MLKVIEGMGLTLLAVLYCAFVVLPFLIVTAICAMIYSFISCGHLPREGTPAGFEYRKAVSFALDHLLWCPEI